MERQRPPQQQLEQDQSWQKRQALHQQLDANFRRSAIRASQLNGFNRVSLKERLEQ